MNAPGTQPSGWYPDPSGRHQHRFWDGAAWTKHVADRGLPGIDEPNRPAPPVTPPFASIPPPAPVTWSAAPLPQYAAPPGAGAPPLSSLGLRFGGYLLDGVLALVTLGIGWIIWCCFTFSKGQTPAKAILNMRVVKQDTGVAATWGDMFIRNVVIPVVLGVVGLFTFGLPTIIAACLIFGGTLRQTGWDRMMGTLVVDDPQGVTVPPGR